MTIATTTDFGVENHGTLWLFIILTDHAREFVAEHVAIPDHMWQGGDDVFAVEHGCGMDLVNGIVEHGLTIAA